MNSTDKRECNLLKLYCEFYAVANLIIGLLTIINYKSLGEAEGLNLKIFRIDLIFILLLNILTYYIAYIFFLKTRNMKIRSGRRIRIEINYHKGHIFFTTVVILQIIFTLATGNGVVYGIVSSQFSFIINAIKVDSFFPIYYVVCRDTSKKLYWINIFLYIFWQIICGWSGVFLTVVFLELYLRIKHGNKNDFVNRISKYKHLLLAAFFTTGSYMYSILFTVKNSIRYHYNFEKITWFEGLEKLLTRISNFPMSVVGIQNHRAISSLYRGQGISNIELKSIFRPILPGFVMEKNFRVIGNELVHSLYKNLGMNTSSEYNPFIRCFNLMEADFFEFIILSFVCIVLFIFSKVIIDLFDTGKHDTDILYFLLILKAACGSSAEALFGYGYLGMIYMIPIMILFGIASIKRE